MAKITQQLKSVSYDSRSGPSPGHRLLAVVLVAMLALGSTFPGFALATEADSEGEGTAPPVEVPVDPDFDPGGEEEGLEETPASGGEEEGGVVEVEPEVEAVAPTAEEVTGAATELPPSTDLAAPQSPEPPPPAVAPAPEAEPVQQKAPEAKTSEPVANKSIVGPKQKRASQQAASADATSGEAAPVGESTPEDEAPSAPPPPAASPPPSDHGRHLAGKNSYVVKSGDCLWHIAARLLPSNAGTEAVEAKVNWLWQTNEARIGTGNPDLIYPGTVLIVR